MDFLHGTDGLGYAGEEEERVRWMFRRIEEMEDLLIEMKQKSGVSKIIELESAVNQANIEIGKKSQIIDELDGRLKDNSRKETLYIDESEAINFFSDLLKEKDQ